MVRVMKHFGYTWEYVLGMRWEVFWLVNKQINRVQAEEDLRLLRIATSSQSSDAAKETSQSLAVEMGRVVVEKVTYDYSGFQKIKNMGKAKAG